MKTKNLVLFAALGLACAVSQAQENTFRVGVAHLDVRSKSDNLTQNGVTIPAGISVGDATTLFLGYTRKLNSNLDLDFSFGSPPEHKVYGRGALDAAGTVAKVKQASPTLFLNYNFGAESNAFRPFVGAGVNYTHFFDADSTRSGNASSGGSTKIKLDDSWGWAVQAGARYNIDQRWSIIGSVALADVESDMRATTTTPSGATIVRRTKIDFRPVVAILSVGYSF